jgi:AraC-like DNA-binding protein/mannose-6-phosphate isomerase-like protein (cupin superfamily)
MDDVHNVEKEIAKLTRSELGYTSEPPRLHFSLPVNFSGPLDQEWPIHDYCELFYVDDGSGIIKINSKSFKIIPGAIFLFQPEDEHSTVLHEKDTVKGAAIHFSPNSLSGEFSSIEPRALYSVSGADYENLKEILENIARENRELPTGARNMSDALLAIFIIKCIRLFGSPLQDRDATPGEAASRRIVEGCTRYIGENFFRPVTLEEAACRTGVSSFYLSHVFSRYTGTTFTEHLLSVRMQAAVELLENPELPLKEIAKRCGYNDVYYFTKVFKKHFLLPPGTYRKNKLSGTKKDKE